MIKFLHRNQKTIMGTVVAAILATSMLGFGVNMMGERSGREAQYAIKVDDKKISFEEFQQARRQTEDRLRSIYGAQYYKIMQAQGGALNQSIVDSLITNAVVDQKVNELELAVSNAELTESIQKEVLPPGGGTAAYEMFLRNSGTTASQFQEEYRKELGRRRLATLIYDSSWPSRVEVLNAAEVEATSYDVKVATFDPAQFEPTLGEPDAEVLKKYYEEHSPEFETPGKVSYEYLPIDSKTFPDLVTVSEDDVQLYYADHQSEFKTTDEIKARHIQITYPKDASAEVKAETKKKAELLLKKVKDGEPFDSLANLYSDDFATKSKGGDLGWLPRGKLDPQFEDALFALKHGNAPELVEMKYGMHVVKVEGYRPSGVKPLADIKDTLIERIKKNETPAYLGTKAEELFKGWTASPLSLPDFAAKSGLVAYSSSGLLSAEEDPNPALKGLTRKISSDLTTKRRIVELPETFVIVNVIEAKEAALPPLEEIKKKVIEKFNRAEARKTAYSKANELIQSKPNDIKQAVLPMNVPVTEEKGVSRNKLVSETLKIPDLQHDLFLSPVEGKILPKAYEGNGKYHVVQITSIKRPEASALESGLSKNYEKEAKAQGDLVLATVVEDLKAQAEKDINPSILVGPEMDYDTDSESSNL